MEHMAPLAAIVLLDLAVIMILTWGVGTLFRRLGQPPVIGEILAGITLGATLIGGIEIGSKPLMSIMFPQNALEQLSGLANLGLVIFMMIVGLELNLRPARASGRRAVVISGSSVVLPLGLGSLLGIWLFMNGYGQSDRVAFALFLGVAMSVTAFPVLARILVERRLHRTALGVLVLACAGVDDVLAWTLLALATALAKGEGAGQLVWVVGLLAVFSVVLVVLVRPALRRLSAWHQRVGHLTPGMLAVVLIGLSLSAAATEWIGVHYVFGAFLFGVILPRDHNAALVRDLLARLEQIAMIVLLPVFFVVTGLKVNIRDLNAEYFWILGLVLLVACVGKFAGAAGAARAMRIPRRQALAVGILMNTRGLTELVVVNVGLMAGILSQDMFTILVMMAVITTVITKPLLRLAYPDALIARDVAEAERAALDAPDAYRSLVLAKNLNSASALGSLAREIAPTGRPAELIICCLTAAPVGRLDVAGGFSHALENVTASLQEANTLADWLTDSTTHCSIIYRLSDDIAADELAEVQHTQPDCVIADHDIGEAADMVDRLPSTGRLLQVRADSAAMTSSPVVVSVRGGPDAAAALATGLALTIRRGSSLAIANVPSRRGWVQPDALVDRLGRAGLAVHLARPSELDSPFMVTERDGSVTSPAVLAVYAATEQSVDDVTRLVDEPVG